MLDLVDMLLKIAEVCKLHSKISGQLAVISPLFVVLSEALRPKCGSHTSHILLSLSSLTLLFLARVFNLHIFRPFS